MQAKLIGPDCCLWCECLNRLTHDFYHTPGYVRLCADQTEGKPLAFVAQDRENWLLIPLIVRPIDTCGSTERRRYDVTSPYGYPSPLLKCAHSEDRRAEFLERAIEILLSTLREHDVVSAFLRLHPTLPIPLEPFRRHGALVLHGQTVFVDLTLPQEELWHQTRKEHRRRINRAKRNGYVVEIDHQWSCFGEFFEIYTETMERVGADDRYFFPRAYFYKLRDALKESLHLCIARIHGSVACATLFTEVCGIVQSHLGGSRPEYAKDAPMIFMNDSVRWWAKKRGNHMFHLGGGLGGSNDSLFRFKSGFSKLRGDFYTWRAIVDVDAYQALVREWEQVVGTKAESLRGYFPAYRTPTLSPNRRDARDRASLRTLI